MTTWIAAIFLVSLCEGDRHPRVSASAAEMSAKTAAGDLLPALKPAFVMLPSRLIMRVPAATWLVIPDKASYVVRGCN